MTLTAIFLGITVAGILTMIGALFTDVEFFEAAGFVLIITGLVLAMVSIVWDEVDDPERGVVIGKRYEDSRWVCAKSCWRDDEDWMLEIDDDGNTGWIEVQERTYNNFQPGDYFGGKG